MPRIGKGKGSTRAREYDANGNYIDNHIYDCTDADLRDIVERVAGKDSDSIVTTGFKIKLRTPDGRIRALPIDWINQQGIKSVDPFRCPVETCDTVFARRYTVARHFIAVHPVEAAEGMEWHEHITTTNYPREAKRSNYHRRSKAELDRLKAANGGVLPKTSKKKGFTQTLEHEHEHDHDAFDESDEDDEYDELEEHESEVAETQSGERTPLFEKTANSSFKPPSPMVDALMKGMTTQQSSNSTVSARAPFRVSLPAASSPQDGIAQNAAAEGPTGRAALNSPKIVNKRPRRTRKSRAKSEDEEGEEDLILMPLNEEDVSASMPDTGQKESNAQHLAGCARPRMSAGKIYNEISGEWESVYAPLNLPKPPGT